MSQQNFVPPPIHNENGLLPVLNLPQHSSNLHFKAIHFDVIPKMKFEGSIFNAGDVVTTSNEVMESLTCDDQIKKWLDQNFNTKKASVANESAKSKKQTITTLLDEKKAFHMDLIFRKFGKFSLQKLAEAVLDMDESVFNSPEILQIFYESGPDENDMELVRNYTGSTADLGPADQFIIKLIQLNIRQFKEKMRLWKSSYDIAGHILHSTKYVNLVTKACRELSSKGDNGSQWKMLLALLLSLHNYLNSGKANRAAYGFKLSSLKNIKYCKSVSNHRKSLFTELVRIIEYKYPLIKLVPIELRSVIKASHMDWDVFYANLNDINDTCNDYTKLMEFAKQTNDRQQHPKFYEFIEKHFIVSERVQKLNELIHEMNLSIAECESLFTMTLTEDHSIIDEFKIVTTFLNDIVEFRIDDPDVKFPEMHRIVTRSNGPYAFSDCLITCTTEKFKAKPAYTIPRIQYQMMLKKKGTNPLIDQLLSDITPDMIID